MPSSSRLFLWCVICIFATVIDGRSSLADNRYGWDRYELPDQPKWAAYFRESAQIRLGRERRLPNGVSWRLLTDIRSGIAIPRLTWMPDKERLRTANRLLDIVQGGEMLVEREERRNVEGENEFRVNHGGLSLPGKRGITQWDVGLTYVGSRLMSLMEAAIIGSAGNKPDVLMRGLTFDLARGTIEQVRPCPDSRTPYGFSHVDGERGNFLFRYGELFQLCDPASYRAFIALVKEIDGKRSARHLPPSASDRTKGCVESIDQPVIREEQEYILYLTFAGLAVQATGKECAVTRTPDNPVIVPYRRLEPFMLPGPWRDELLSPR